MGNPFGEIFNQQTDSSVDNGQLGGQDGGQAQGTGYNPNFQPLLNDLPQDLHGKILPHLQQWDKGVNERFQKLQSDYEPWKPVFSSGATPEMVQNGLNILNLLERDPQSLYNALGENYQFGQSQQQPADQGQQSPQNQQAPSEIDQLDPRFSQLENNFTTLAQHVLDIRQQEANARADSAMHREFTDAHDKVGKFDDKWVLAQCITDENLSVIDAAKMYQQWYNAEMAQHGARPLITGSSGGGVPGTNMDPTKWSGKETRMHVADMIEAAKRTLQT